jgi:hypothetical protein
MPRIVNTPPLARDLLNENLQGESFWNWKRNLGDVASAVFPGTHRESLTANLLNLGMVGGKRFQIDDIPWANKAKSHFGTTTNPDEAGYILSDGRRLDFSGRHYAVGYERGPEGAYRPKVGEKDYLLGGRNVDHRELPDEVFSFDAPGDEPGLQMLEFMGKARALRFQPGEGISTSFLPSRVQLNRAILDLPRPMTVDVDHPVTGATIASKEFRRPTVSGILKFIEDNLSGLPSFTKYWKP